MCFHLSRCAVDLKVNIAMASVTPVKTPKKKKSVFLLNLEKRKKKKFVHCKKRVCKSKILGKRVSMFGNFRFGVYLWIVGLDLS